MKRVGDRFNRRLLRPQRPRNGEAASGKRGGVHPYPIRAAERSDPRGIVVAAVVNPIYFETRFRGSGLYAIYHVKGGLLSVTYCDERRGLTSIGPFAEWLDTVRVEEF